MRSFLDTSVLIAAFHVGHQHHPPSFGLFLHARKEDTSCGVHSLAEVYSTLTGLRSPARRASGDDAMLFLSDVRQRCTLVGLNEQEYCQTLEDAAAAGIAGGAIYDALLGQCALKSGAAALYTWNTRDFLRLPAAIAARVRTPDQADL